MSFHRIFLSPRWRRRALTADPLFALSKVIAHPCRDNGNGPVSSLADGVDRIRRHCTDLPRIVGVERARIKTQECQSWPSDPRELSGRWRHRVAAPSGQFPWPGLVERTTSRNPAEKTTNPPVRRATEPIEVRPEGIAILPLLMIPRVKILDKTNTDPL